MALEPASMSEGFAERPSLLEAQTELARPLHIAGVDPERRFSGGETQVMGLTLALIKSGHQAELICDPAGELGQRAQEAGIACHPLRIRNSIDVAAGLRLRALVAREQYDIVHFHTARAHALAPYVCARGRTLVVTRRMDYLPNRLFAPWLYNHAVDGVAAISAGVADALRRGGVRSDLISLIPSGVDCEHFIPPSPVDRTSARSALGLDEDDVVIGTAGSLTERKGHHALLEAIAILRRDFREQRGVDNLQCVIAGSGPLQNALASAIRERGLSDVVRLIGSVDKIRAMLWALDIFVMPSLSEGLGVAALEAMACGLPVVASDVGGLHEVVKNGETGLLTRPGDAQELSRAIAELASSRPKRAAMGAAARQRVLAHFEISAMAQATLELYHRSRARIAPTRAHNAGAIAKD